MPTVSRAGSVVVGVGVRAGGAATTAAYVPVIGKGFWSRPNTSTFSLASSCQNEAWAELERGWNMTTVSGDGGDCCCGGGGVRGRLAMASRGGGNDAAAAVVSFFAELRLGLLLRLCCIERGNLARQVAEGERGVIQMLDNKGQDTKEE